MFSAYFNIKRKGKNKFSEIKKNNCRLSLQLFFFLYR